MMLDLGHFGDEAGAGDEFRRCIASGADEFDLARCLFHQGEYLHQFEKPPGKSDIDFIGNHQFVPAGLDDFSQPCQSMLRRFAVGRLLPVSRSSTGCRKIRR